MRVGFDKWLDEAGKVLVIFGLFEALLLIVVRVFHTIYPWNIPESFPCIK